MPATAFAHTEDPAEKLLKDLGDLSALELFHTQVLVAIYVAPEKTAGGIIRPQSNIDEDLYQSKVGLIVKLGPQAFQSSGQWTWPDDIGLSDWVYFKVSDSFACAVNRVKCRILEDVDIKGRVSHPDTMW